VGKRHKERDTRIDTRGNIQRKETEGKTERGREIEGNMQRRDRWER
jgi:hypothetical protein